MNTVVRAFRNDTASVASTEQVGSYKKVGVGDLLVIEVGASKSAQRNRSIWLKQTRAHPRRVKAR